jgi:hypothetical protein
VDVEALHDLEIRTAAGEALKHLYVLEIELVNRGPDIASDRFDGGAPLLLDVGVPIVNVGAVKYSRRSNGQLKTAPEGTVLRVGPDFIGKSQKISISLLAVGSGARLSCKQATINGVDVVPQEGRRKAPPSPGTPAEGDDVPSELDRRHGLRRKVVAVLAVIAVVSLVTIVAIVLVGLLQPTYAVSIAAPSSTVDCRGAGPQCPFTIAGHSTGAGSDLEIYVLVFPVRPSGGGWFVQSPSAFVAGNGDWNQTPAYVGSSTSPSGGGDTFRIAAVLVQVNATYQGFSLDDLASQGTSISDLRQINGLVTQSDSVLLRIQA